MLARLQEAPLARPQSFTGWDELRNCVLDELSESSAASSLERIGDELAAVFQEAQLAGYSADDVTVSLYWSCDTQVGDPTPTAEVVPPFDNTAVDGYAVAGTDDHDVARLDPV